MYHFFLNTLYRKFKLSEKKKQHQKNKNKKKKKKKKKKKRKVIVNASGTSLGDFTYVASTKLNVANGIMRSKHESHPVESIVQFAYPAP